MKTRYLLLFSILVVLAIQACTVYSFYPIYTAETLVEEDAIIGTWTEAPIQFNDHSISSDSITWVIKKNTGEFNTFEDSTLNKKYNHKAYFIEMFSSTDPDMIFSFSLHLIKIKNTLIANFYLQDKTESSDVSLAVIHLFPVHTFAKVEIDEQGSVHFNWISSGFFNQLLEDGKIRIQYEEYQSEKLVTSKPEELQRFIAKYIDDPRIFEGDYAIKLNKMDNE